MNLKLAAYQVMMRVITPAMMKKKRALWSQRIKQHNKWGKLLITLLFQFQVNETLNLSSYQKIYLIDVEEKGRKKNAIGPQLPEIQKSYSLLPDMATGYTFNFNEFQNLIDHWW